MMGQQQVDRPVKLSRGSHPDKHANILSRR